MKTIISLLVTFLCLWAGPTTQAVSPSPDGCYPNSTTAEGCKALQSLTTGIGNTGIDWYSLFATTTGNFHTAVGAGSLDPNTADYNTAVGVAALLLNTTGTNNTANGAFRSVSTGGLEGLGNSPFCRGRNRKQNRGKEEPHFRKNHCL